MCWGDGEEGVSEDLQGCPPVSGGPAAVLMLVQAESGLRGLGRVGRARGELSWWGPFPLGLPPNRTCEFPRVRLSSDLCRECAGSSRVDVVVPAALASDLSTWNIPPTMSPARVPSAGPVPTYVVLAAPALLRRHRAVADQIRYTVIRDGTSPGRLRRPRSNAIRWQPTSDGAGAAHTPTLPPPATPDAHTRPGRDRSCNPAGSARHSGTARHADRAATLRPLGYLRDRIPGQDQFARTQRCPACPQVADKPGLSSMA